MRVIAGSLRGRRLTAPAGRRSTRPTSDRVREALFSTLGDIHGAIVLDLFAGTGALGIEALSRGAARALFVERDRAALRALRSNLSALGLGPPRAEVRAGEALAALRTARARVETYDLLFVDPPYARAGELEGALARLLPAVLGEPDGRVVVESDRRAPLRLALDLLIERRYGDTLITIYGKICAEGSGRVPDRGGAKAAGPVGRASTQPSGREDR
jgi:16S rRNA (guanine966-N2)-methyltransferase